MKKELAKYNLLNQKLADSIKAKVKNFENTNNSTQKTR